MKYCKRCKTLKDNIEFAVGESYKDGLRPYCKKCMAEMQRQRAKKTIKKLNPNVIRSEKGHLNSCHLIGTIIGEKDDTEFAMSGMTNYVSGFTDIIIEVKYRAVREFFQVYIPVEYSKRLKSIDTRDQLDVKGRFKLKADGFVVMADHITINRKNEDIKLF